ncbi:MAG: DUF2267 domain-containing protein [Alphaproteobacteria bacterium]
MTGIPRIDDAPAAGEEWVANLQERLGWRDRGMAYTALLATLHALRDHLPADEAVTLGAGLPVLLRGLYYESWHLHDKPMPLEDRETFLLRLHEALHREIGIDPEPVARAVFELLSRRISAPDLEEIRAATPAPLHGLWPD